MRPARVDESAEPADPRDDTMPDEEITDEIIMGFVKWAQKKAINADVHTEAEMAYWIDQYMRSRMAGG